MSIALPGVTTVLDRMLARPGQGTSIDSPVAVWLLLAAAAAGATGAAHKELTAVVGEVDPGAVAGTIRDLRGQAGVAAGLGAWVGHGHRLQPAWTAPLTGQVDTGPIPAQVVLDRWAADRTDGLIPKFPVTVTPSAILVLAAALVAKASWRQPFEENRGRLTRTAPRTASPVLLTAAGTVAAIIATTSADLEVLLGLGEPGAHPAAALADLARGNAVPVEAGDEGRLPSWVTVTPAQRPTTSLALRSFDISADRDLLADPDAFGLGALTRAFHGPNLLSRMVSGDEPVQVTAAAASTRMTFDALGFAAGSVAAMSMRAGSMPLLSPPRERCVRLDFDRPFAVLVRTCGSRLPLFCGWVMPAAPAVRTSGPVAV